MSDRTQSEDAEVLVVRRASIVPQAEWCSPLDPTRPAAAGTPAAVRARTGNSAKTSTDL